jgi:hypothetical protein
MLLIAYTEHWKFVSLNKDGVKYHPERRLACGFALNEWGLVCSPDLRVTFLHSFLSVSVGQTAVSSRSSNTHECTKPLSPLARSGQAKRDAPFFVHNLFAVHLTVLAAAQVTPCRRTAWNWNDLEGDGRTLRCLPENVLQTLRKTTTTLSQDTACPSLDTNQAPPLC